ncbi:MAG: hypothetical protein GTO40_11540, partial [Deltaproteobacteria bacterium]|nr:hypothetical protein [Deltaproteobacteria bacterium]
MERERVREREPEQKDSGDHYNKGLEIYEAERERAQRGKIVLRSREIPWRQNRQALVKTFLSSHGISDSAASNWICFIHDIKVHSGKHRHQGGIHLFILEGEGT